MSSERAGLNKELGVLAFTLSSLLKPSLDFFQAKLGAPMEKKTHWAKREEKVDSRAVVINGYFYQNAFMTSII